MEAPRAVPASEGPSERDDVIAGLRAENASLQQALKRTQLERDYLKEQLAARLRQLFAARSEARSEKQTDLFFDEAEALVAATPAAGEQAVSIPAHVRRGKRKPLDAALPRVVVRHELADAERICPHDGTLLQPFGVEISEQLDIIPAQLRVIRHERVKYGCPCCAQGVAVAPAPLRLLPKALLTESALAWVITAKYQDALPLYRQAALLKRCGGEVARHTLAHNTVRVGQAVQPLINLLRDRVLESPVIHGDETELQVLKENGRAAQAKSYLWLQMTNTGPPVRLFTYAPSRSSQTALALYAGVSSGVALLTDGYEPYASVAATHQLVHLGCWAHARRRFIEAEELVPKAERSPTHPASALVRLIGELYRIEARELDADARLALRQRASAPLIENIEGLLLAHLHTVAPQSALGKALHYLHGQWPKLVRFLTDGRYPVDNNTAENAIRPFVIGRRNWLFSDTVKGAQASANLYSLIETAKANGRDPYRYLCHLFTALPHANTVEALETLLPWNAHLGG